jgi:hypothetical protein
MTILGIDPGKSGTVAVLDEGGDLLEMHDMPSTLGSNGRSATNAPLLARILARTHARIAFCEFVGARPTDAKVAACGVDRAEACLIAFAGLQPGAPMTREGFGGRLMKFTVYQGSRQLIDGESEGKNHVISIDPESPRHRGHPAALANKQRHSLAPEGLRERNCRMEGRNDLRCRKRSTERRSKH